MRTQLILQVAANAEVALRASNDASKQMQELLAAGEPDADVYLDIIDAVLANSNTQHSALERVLQAGQSVWTVAADGRSLQERVHPTARLALERATSPTDVAGEELSAVEAALIPLVVPRQDRPQLGHVLGTLDRQGELFVLRLGDADGIETLVSMLRLLWPNPDRHGSPSDRRAPTQDEARAVVHLAITIIQWMRDGLLQPR